MRGALWIVLLGACAGDESPRSVATGQLEAWASGPALPTPRANHCSAVIDDWVVVIGGNYKQADGTFVKTDEIHAARVDANGVGAWQLAGRTASPVTECTATSDGRTLFVIDGIYDREGDGRQVFTATLDEGGMLSQLTSMATLPQAAISSEAAVRDGQVLMMDTLLPDEGDETVTMRMSVGGGAWTSDPWGIGFRAQAQYAFADGYAYTIGGYGSGDEGNPVTDEVFVATIGDGVSEGRATTKLPVPTTFGEAVAIDDWVFVVGGRSAVFGAQASNKVYAAQVGADGALGSWAEVEALPMGRTNHEVVAAGEFLVSLGGAGEAGGDANVLVARARF